MGGDKMNIHNEKYRKKVLEYISELGLNFSLEHVKLIFEQYDSLYKKLCELYELSGSEDIKDGELDKYWACVEFLQEELNKFLYGDSCSSIQYPHKPSTTFINLNNTIH